MTLADCYVGDFPVSFASLILHKAVQICYRPFTLFTYCYTVRWL